MGAAARDMARLVLNRERQGGAGAPAAAADCPGPRKGATTRRNVTQGGERPDHRWWCSLANGRRVRRAWGGGGLLAVGNAAVAGVGVWECLWGRVMAGAI